MPSSNPHPKEVQATQCGVVTISDTRTPQTDEGGPLIVQQLVTAGHRVVSHEIVADDVKAIRTQIQQLCEAGCEAIILTGGTGIAPRDVTVEALRPLLEKQLDGFAELFRQLSFEQIGPKAMLSRALAGTIGHSIVFSLPGSPKAVHLAMNRLILPVLPHAVAVLRP